MTKMRSSWVKGHREPRQGQPGLWFRSPAHQQRYSEPTLGSKAEAHEKRAAALQLGLSQWLHSIGNAQPGRALHNHPLLLHLT
jgi:hypothetical protein